jgi:hypothetical protein
MLYTIEVLVQKVQRWLCRLADMIGLCLLSPLLLYGVGTPSEKNSGPTLDPVVPLDGFENKRHEQMQSRGFDA